MKTLNVKLLGSYRSKNGNTTFRYGVSGNAEALEAYAEAQGEFHVIDEDTGSPLWFTVRFIGKTGKLIITDKGKIVPDMSEFDQAASLAAQYGGNFGAELAKAQAQNILSRSGIAPESTAPTSASAPDAPDTVVEDL